MMGIRQPAAEKLARKILELLPPRLLKLEPKFYETMSRVIMVYVDMDEQRQRAEKLMEPSSDAAPHAEGEKNDSR